jgi:hypothetical protein
MHRGTLGLGQYCFLGNLVRAFIGVNGRALKAKLGGAEAWCGILACATSGQVKGLQSGQTQLETRGRWADYARQRGFGFVLPNCKGHQQELPNVRTFNP